MAKRNVGDIRKAANDVVDARIKSLELSKQEYASLQNITQVERNRYDAMIDAQKEKLQLDALQNEYAKDYNQLTTQQKKAMDTSIKKQREKVDETERELGIAQRTTEELKKQVKWHQKISSTIKELNDFIGGSAIWKFLMEADKGIKKTALQLGLSGERSGILRYNIEQSAQYAARMGVSVGELAEAQQLYVEETGRALFLNQEGLEAIVAMGKATGLGVQGATKLAAQYESIGISVVGTAEKVQGIVDQSERMGVSTTKMLKKVSENFEAINKFAFRNGVDSFSKMAMYAERFKIDMGSMLDSADKARTLEGAVALAAELQIMGGEFAKTDPFELLFLSRNDPEKYQKKINNMTKGIATFRKTADGTFEAYISPMDLDRLDRAGKALGLSREELAKQAKQMAKMRSISRDLIGTGISAKDREMIAGMAKIDSKTGEFMISLKGESVKVASIGKQHLKILSAQSKSLTERGLAAQTFDDAWSNTIQEFKATLLPMIQGINKMLESARPTIIKFMNWFGGVMSSGKGFLIGLGSAAAILVAASKIIGFAVSKAANIGNIFGGGGGATKGTGPAEVLSGGAKKGIKGAGANAGKGMLRGGAGIGAAALGIGAGVGAAAGGISLLADAMDKLDEKQLDTLQGIVTTLGIFMGIGVAAAVGVAALGATAAAAAPGLLAFGAAVFMVGSGIGIAAAGIGYMSQGIATLGDPVVAKNLGITAEGLTGIMGAFSGGLFSGGFTSLLAGIGKFATAGLAIRDMASQGSGMKDVGYGFQQIAAVMNGDTGGLDRIKNTIKSISEMDMDKGNVLSKLTKLLSQPLKVEFADSKVALNVNATLELDGDVIYRKVMSKKVNLSAKNDSNEGKGMVTDIA